MIELKRMIKKFLTLSMLGLFTSCSFFSNKVESIVDSQEKKNSTAVKSNKKNLHCTDNNNLQLLLEDDSTIKYYHSFTDRLFNTKNYSFIQKAAMLSLIEMSRRPDEASPQARLQYFLRYKGKDYYFDFRPLNLDDDSKMPFLKGIDVLLKNFDQTRPLSKLADALDLIIPQTINVSSELETFLQNRKNELVKDEILTDVFIKGDEVLTRHESFKRISYKKIVSLYFGGKLNLDSQYEFSKNSLTPMDVGQADLNLKCNTDINKEISLKEDAFNSSQKSSHYFAIKDGDNFFIAVSSSLIAKPLKNYKGTYFFKSLVTPTPLPVCQFTNKQEDIVLFSTTGKNPAQHLKHLVTYDISAVDSYPSLEELLNFSRHLFLSTPDRILYESRRGRKSQLDFFLSMNFPIYHVDALGDIIGSAGFTRRGLENRSLIVDDRSPAKLWCMP